MEKLHVIWPVKIYNLTNLIMTKLWKKSGTKTNPAVNDYIISENCAADNVLLPYDIKASISHAKMLCKVSLLSNKEMQSLVSKLKVA